MRKPAFCICENKGADRLGSNCIVYYLFAIFSVFTLMLSHMVQISELFLYENMVISGVDEIMKLF